VSRVLFANWMFDRDPDELVWDIAISYASEDTAIARQIANALTDFKFFYSPDQSGALWGADLTRVLPNTYGVQSRFVLVLSTPAYVNKHWTIEEFRAAAGRHPERILLLEMGALPADLPPEIVYRGSSDGEMIGLIAALRSRLNEAIRKPPPPSEISRKNGP